MQEKMDYNKRQFLYNILQMYDHHVIILQSYYELYVCFQTCERVHRQYREYILQIVPWITIFPNATKHKCYNGMADVLFSKQTRSYIYNMRYFWK